MFIEDIKTQKPHPFKKPEGWSNNHYKLELAKINKNDEFYTRYEDIEKEIEMYDVNTWQDKVVFCNCNDWVDTKNIINSSTFAQYFIQNFKRLKLKKLICTSYSGKVTLFNKESKGYIFTKIRTKEYKEYPNNYTGSFDDSLSLKILNEEADIVCTNPPFSRAIDYWKILINSNKKFLVIGNIIYPINAIFCSYMKVKKVWAGYNNVNKFLNPKKELVSAPGYWYTNFIIKNRHSKKLKIMPLKDIPDKYKRYTDNGLLVVDNGYIPNDYNKPFGVSVTPLLNGVLENGYKIIKRSQSTHGYRYPKELLYPLVIIFNKKLGFYRTIIEKEAEGN